MSTRTVHTQPVRDTESGSALGLVGLACKTILQRSRSQSACDYIIVTRSPSASESLASWEYCTYIRTSCSSNMLLLQVAPCQVPYQPLHILKLKLSVASTVSKQTHSKGSIQYNVAMWKCAQVWVVLRSNAVAALSCGYIELSSEKPCANLHSS